MKDVAGLVQKWVTVSVKLWIYAGLWDVVIIPTRCGEP